MGFWVEGFGFRVEGFGFSVEGFGFSVEGIWGFYPQPQGFVAWNPDPKGPDAYMAYYTYKPMYICRIM